MATGSGKTVLMAMIITWQVLNALTYPKRNKDFSRAIFIVAPGITVKERLRVLYPGEPDNAYDMFGLCPPEALRQKLNQAEILIENWHSLMPLKITERSVVKKGAESDEAFTRNHKSATWSPIVAGSSSPPIFWRRASWSLLRHMVVGCRLPASAVAGYIGEALVVEGLNKNLMERKDFETLVARCLATIPAEYLARLDNLTFVVEEWAPDDLLAEYDDADPLDFLGDYRGCPLPERSQGDAGGLPDLIVLYQGAIEAYAQEFDEPLEKVIRETLVHEIAHYFGFSEEQMDTIEALWQEGE